MFRTSLCSAVLLLAASRIAASQAIATTVAAAEAEGAAFAPSTAPARVEPMFSMPFLGSADRRCVSAPNRIIQPDSSLRSGEMMMRTPFGGEYAPRAGRASKILWVARHAPTFYPSGLLITVAK